MNYLTKIIVFSFLFLNIHLFADDEFSIYLRDFERSYSCEMPVSRMQILEQDTASIDYCYNIHSLLNDSSVIKLDDGSLWEIPRFGNHNGVRVELPFQNRVKNWKGDESYKIVKYDLAKDIQFALYNKHAVHGEHFVAIKLISAPNVAHTAICIINLDKSGKEIVLSDGSYWNVSFYDSFWSSKWQVGDMMVVAYRSVKDKRPKILINASLNEVYCQANVIK